MRKITFVIFLIGITGFDLYAQPVKNIIPAAAPEAAGISSFRVTKLKCPAA